MTETQSQVLLAAQTKVTDIFSNKVKKQFVFHNLDHTRKVAFAAELLAAHYKLNDDDQFVLLIAAWFHDTGFSGGRAEDHEKESARIATEFLHAHSVDQHVIQRIGSAIEATHMPQSPVGLVEKILCDADLYHLGTDDFKELNQLLYKEQESYFGQKIPKKEWRQRNIEFLENHKYFTDYCQQKLEPKKQENLSALKKKQGKNVPQNPEAEISPFTFEKENEKSSKGMDKREAENIKNTERGIQTMFRTTSGNHFNLSSMADSKANIMISVNSIIISIVVSVVMGRLEYYPHYIYPTILLLIVCLVATIFAILATRPSISGGKFTEDDIRNKKTNLLFFGNFHRMALDEYQWGMNEMLKDREYLYSSMIKDIYFLGVVLARKYRFLRISYTVFMYGLIASVLAFGVTVLIDSYSS
jgi:predicted metal-dependent HD superfamily phosphohydrolase